MQLSKKDLSRKLFDEGLALKRQGRFEESIGKYKESISIYLDDPELNSAFYALGKVYYLNQEYELSFSCYQTHFYLTIVPEMLSDYRAFCNDTLDEFSKQNFIKFLLNPARHIGHAILDKRNANENPKEIMCYCYSIMGKNKNDDARLRNIDEESYNSQCEKVGINVIEDMLQKAMQKNFIDNELRELIPSILRS